MRQTVAVLILTLFSNVASAAQFHESFSGDTLDPEEFMFTGPPGYDAAIVDGELQMSKLEGTTSGYAHTSTYFTVRGDFDSTVVAERVQVTTGFVAGLLTSHINRGFSDIYFNQSGNLVSNIVVGGLDVRKNIATPAETLTLRIRREGNHLMHEYDAGSGFVLMNEAADPVLGGSVFVTMFIGEEAGQSAPTLVRYDDFDLEGDVFTPCGNGVLDDGEVCDNQKPDWIAGNFCNGACEIVPCGDADDSGSITVTDALHALRTSVGTKTCDSCVCNIDASGGESPTTVADALGLLRYSVGQPVDLNCPACS